MLIRAKLVRSKTKKLSASKSIVNTLFLLTAKNSQNIKFGKDNMVARLIGFFQLQIF